MNAYNAVATMLSESILNLAWLTIALTAIAGIVLRRRDARTITALIGIIALLFPIISITDDFSADKTLFEEVVAVLAAVCAVVALRALFNLATAPLVVAPVHRAVLSDPRSPPRG